MNGVTEVWAMIKQVQSPSCKMVHNSESHDWGNLLTAKTFWPKRTLLHAMRMHFEMLAADRTCESGQDERKISVDTCSKKQHLSVHQVVIREVSMSSSSSALFFRGTHLVQRNI